jgi:hypothetical protein
VPYHAVRFCFITGGICALVGAAYLGAYIYRVRRNEELSPLAVAIGRGSGDDLARVWLAPSVDCGGGSRTNLIGRSFWNTPIEVNGIGGTGASPVDHRYFIHDLCPAASPLAGDEFDEESRELLRDILMGLHAVSIAASPHRCPLRDGFSPSHLGHSGFATG